MSDTPLLVNPRATELGRRHALLWGRGARRYHVAEFPGPLSIKAVVRGTAEWRAGGSRFEVDSGSYLILNRGQRYTITIDAPEPVETFCVFFQDGFVEDAWRSATQSDARLLDDPFKDAEPAGFYERLRPCSGEVASLLAGLYRRVSADRPAGEESLYRMAEALLHLRADLPREVGRLPARRASTRHELYRRLLAGKRLLDESLADPLSLAEVARAACLSPFHFHRLFKAAFRQTPHEYLQHRRIERSARLLRETRRPVTDICLESGFQSPGSFSTLFRAHYGLSPRRFREAKFARSEKFSA